MRTVLSWVLRGALPVVLLSTALPGTAAAEPDPRLIGPEWSLISLRGAPPMGGRKITARFDNESVAGSAGCNRYNAGYEAEGERFRLTSGPISTLMLCSPPAVMRQEQAFLEALQDAQSYRIDGGALTLRDGAGNAVAMFLRPGCAP